MHSVAITLLLLVPCAALSAAMITVSGSVECSVNGIVVDSTAKTVSSNGPSLISLGGTEGPLFCSAPNPPNGPTYALLGAGAGPFSLYFSSAVSSAPLAFPITAVAEAEISITTRAVVTGGSGMATILPLNQFAPFTPGGTCSISIDSSPASCTSPIVVQFGVPFLMQVTVSTRERAPGSFGGHRQWNLLSSMVFQDGELVPDAVLAEVEIPEPATVFLAAAGLLAGGLLHLRKS